MAKLVVTMEMCKRILALEIEKDYTKSLKELNSVHKQDMKTVDKAKTIQSLIRAAEMTTYCPSNRAWNLLDKLEDTLKGESK